MVYNELYSWISLYVFIISLSRVSPNRSPGQETSLCLARLCLFCYQTTLPFTLPFHCTSPSFFPSHYTSPCLSLLHHTNPPQATLIFSTTSFSPHLIISISFPINLSHRSLSSFTQSLGSPPTTLFHPIPRAVQQGYSPLPFLPALPSLPFPSPQTPT